MSSPEMQHLPPGTLLDAGHYRIARHIGAGDFGQTYLAENTKMGVRGIYVVIKEFFIRDEMFRQPGTTFVEVTNNSKLDEMRKMRRKFIREAQRIYSLNHPGIVRILDIISDENNTSYYVMDYVGDHSLADLLEERGALPEDEAVNYTEQVLKALRKVHANRMLHLDVRPSNIMLNEEGRTVLTNFGTSKVVEPQQEGLSTSMAYTPGYAPVEQVSGDVHNIDPRTDIYSVGATLYTLLTNKRPPEPMSILKHRENAFDFPASVSESMRQAVYAMMDYLSDKRPSTADEALKLLSHPSKSTYKNSFEGGNWYNNMFEEPSTDRDGNSFWEDIKPNATHPVAQTAEIVESKSANTIDDTEIGIHLHNTQNQVEATNINGSNQIRYKAEEPNETKNTQSQHKRVIIIAALAGLIIVIVSMLLYRSCSEDSEPIYYDLDENYHTPTDTAETGSYNDATIS